MNLVVAIAAGGAVGALSRHYVNVLMVHWLGHGFPYGTLAVNIIGSFIMGVMIELFALKYDPSPELRAFIATGLLGALTTFSTFSLDFATLFQRGDTGTAFIYVALSVVAAIGALFAGLHIVRAALGG